MDDKIDGMMEKLEEALTYVSLEDLLLIKGYIELELIVRQVERIVTPDNVGGGE